MGLRGSDVETELIAVLNQQKCLFFKSLNPLAQWNPIMIWTLKSIRWIRKGRNETQCCQHIYNLSCVAIFCLYIYLGDIYVWELSNSKSHQCPVDHIPLDQHNPIECIQPYQFLVMSKPVPEHVCILWLSHQRHIKTHEYAQRFVLLCNGSMSLEDKESKVYGAIMGPIWFLSAPDGPHVGPMNLAIRGIISHSGEILLGDNRDSGNNMNHRKPSTSFVHWGTKTRNNLIVRNIRNTHASDSWYNAFPLTCQQNGNNIYNSCIPNRNYKVC